MTIKWFPGHMHSARKQIIEVMPKIDVAVEVVDARLPASSGNPLLAELRQQKPFIKVLNKADLADPQVTKAWVKYFEKSDHGLRAVAINAGNKGDVSRIPKLCRSLAPQRGKPGRPLRVMVMGIPNVGKSTLINTLAGKRIAQVGDRPAITRHAQQIDLRNGILLFDTPGILWPNLEDQQGAYRLAASGAIGDNAMDYQNVAVFAADYLRQSYLELLATRYKLKDMPEEPTELLDEIGRRRGCLGSGGVVDSYRAAEVLLRDLQSGKIGRVSFESPPAIA
ncbi:ribosome biogenesis GTPase YlqF [Syntrophotalea acetylenivorans]|uniref:Ribosome biogenesis GTPase A n=1 Tax=Syntrophotalea acetylenivorans TaxID=1842532 RepID=A0A1L3GNX8_9BACT|nr:ribosome biogenesis GTPase YlqF [Syntrophotalea acetylenivorans]APG27622.1 ribosome biogenesis GTPase YlqF [Syntrophotalea acetylenivorans]